MNDLSRIDWNLLPALDALLTEKSVSRAARRTGVTQPAMSNALKRLRRHFRDELMVRSGNAYQLTPVGERLAPLTSELVRSTVDITSSVASFDPRSSSRRFTIAATEAMQTTLVPAVLTATASAAPGTSVTLVAPFVEPFRTFDDVLAGTDGWLAPSEMLPGRNHTGQWWDEWVCVVSDDHPTVGDHLTLDDVDRLAWVVPTIRGTPIDHVGVFAAHGLDPHVAVYTEGFVSVPFLVGGTERVGIVQGAVANRLAPAAGVRAIPCPWPTQPLRVTFWWDQRWASDPAHTWFRDLVEATMLAHRVAPAG
ncbi:LysR family transcriptional regulator [Aeromicrobium fastidiosum]|uniref:LysR family transcriptional regulator n=1 Tax=Aeromicrobium fastidiosum TaxID=52699 RepID=UPI0020232EAB|nr:LysR family transcriptional regulator [Aeromicrobium fastidiosum]MCL8249986.1 LysR family transcriptional regulator [Aeromicrobium fastidiosum]